MILLLVDDEFHVRKKLLHKIDWEALGIDTLLEAEDGESGYETAKRRKIDILISDIRMPRMDGIEMAGKIRELYPDCVILFLSGLGAVFQPLVPLVLFWRGMGFGALGVCSYAAGQSSNSLYYLLVLLPRALGEVLLLICAGGCALRFSSRFFYALFPKEVSEQTPIRQTPQGGLLGYLLRYLIFYFLGGSVALLSSLLEFAFSLIGQ